MDTLPASLDSHHEADLLRRALATACICAWEFDLASGQMTWTDAVFRLHDADPRGETPTLERALGFFAPEARAPFAQAVRRAVESGTPWDLELPLVTASGRRVWVRSRGGTERTPDGHCSRLTGTYEDVTAAHRTRDAVAQQRGEQGMLALVAENTSDAVIVTDAHDLVQWVNGSFTRLTGYPLAEVAGRRPRDLLNHPDMEHMAAFHAALAARARHEPVIGAELKLVRKDGTAYWAMVEVREVCDAGGAVTHHIHIHRDITERRNADERNRALLERLQLTAALTGFGYAERDLDSGAAIWDAQTFRLHGLEPPAEGLAVGPSPAEIEAIIEPEDRSRLRAFYAHARAAGGSIEFEYRVRDRQRGVRHLQARGGVTAPLPGGGRRSLAVVMDVTATRLAERQRDAQEQRLARAISAANLGAWEVDLAANTIEWNTPMRRIFGLPDGIDPPLITELVQRCVHPAQRERAAQNILDFLHRGGTYEDELHIVQPDGIERWVLLRAALHRGHEDAPGRVIGVALDVTEQRAGADRLKEALGRLELATNNAGVGTYTRNTTTGVGHWDRKTYELFGIEPRAGAPDYDTILAAVHPEDRERYRAVVRGAGSLAEPRELEVRVVLRDGSVRWLLIRGSSPGEELERRAGVVIDITARKLAEQRATEYAEWLRLSSSAVGIGLWQRDLTSEAKFWDEQMRRMFDLAADAPLPDLEGLVAMTHPDDRAHAREHLALPPPAGQVTQFAFRLVRANGETRHLLSRRAAHYDADDRPVRVYGAVLDVTESQRSADALLRSQSRFELTSNVAEIGFFERPLDKGLGYWSEQMWRMFGEQPHAVAPTWEWLLERILPEDHAAFEERWEQLEHSATYIDNEFRVRRPDGSIAWLQSRARLERGERPRVVGVTLDISARRHAAWRAQEVSNYLRLVTGTVGVGLWHYDLDSNEPVWDVQVKRIFGLADDEPVPAWEQYLEMVVPEDRSRVTALRENRPAPGEISEVEYRIRRRDAQVRHVLSRRMTTLAHDGSRRVLGATLDVTEAREAEARVRAVAERLRLAVEAGRFASWEQNLETGSGCWDPMMFEFHGLAPGEASPPFDAIVARVMPDDRRHFVESYERAGHSEGPVEWEYRVPSHGDRVLHILSRARAERRADGTPWRVIGASIDVTEVRQTASRLNEAQQRLQHATVASGIGTWERNLETGEGRWDPLLYRLYGVEPRDHSLPRAELLQLVHPDDRPALQKFWHEMRNNREAVTCEFRVIRPDGELAHLYARGRGEFSPDGRPVRVLGATLDVTVTRQAQKRLQEFSDRLSLASSATGIGFWEYGSDINVIACDRQTRLTFGFDPDTRALTLAHFIERVIPEDRPIIVDAWRRAAGAGETIEYEYRIRHPQLGVRTIFSRRTTRSDDGGKLVRHIGVSIDVTASREAARSLREATARLELATRTAGIGVWHRNLVTGAGRWDAGMQAIYGLDAGQREPDARTWLSLVHPDDRDLMRAMLSGHYAQRGTGEVEFRIRRADGAERFILESFSVQRDESGRAVLAIGTNLDITERRAAESAARDAEQQMRELLERMQFSTGVAGLGLWEYDVGTLQSHMDDVVYALYGLTREQMPDLARHWVSRVHPDDRARVRAEAARMRDGEPHYESEFRIVRPDGAVRHLAGRARRIVDAGGRQRVLGVNWDITDRRQAEGALQAKEVAERANQAKTEFLSRMSHELRTPLNAIIGFTQVLELDRSQPLTPLQHDRVEKIRQGGWHLLTLINEILDLSRIEAGEMKLAMAMVPLAAVVDECVALVSAEAARRGIQISQLQTPTAPDQVWADRTRVKQVVLNLLSNAVKYNREGGRIDVRLASDEQGRAVIGVRDTGHGMTATQLANLFQPFNRLGREHGAVEGTGIGLAISQKLAQQMGGDITASSEPGAGSEFRFALQAASTSHDESVDVLHGIVSAVASAPETQGTVLYVEDNASNVAVVEQLLALRPKVKLFTAPDGASGRVLAAVCQPDLILLDMRLPDTDGLALLRELRAHPETAAIPCVGLSANALPGDVAHARANGFLDYWTKPIEAAPFLRGVDALLARRATTRGG